MTIIPGNLLNYGKLLNWQWDIKKPVLTHVNL